MMPFLLNWRPHNGKATPHHTEISENQNNRLLYSYFQNIRLALFLGKQFLQIVTPIKPLCLLGFDDHQRLVNIFFSNPESETI